MGFIPGMSSCFKIQKPINVIHHINRLKKKVTLSYAEKLFYKIQHPCMIKPLRKVGIGQLPQYDKGHLQKNFFKNLAVNIIFNSEKLNVFPLRLGE